MDNRSDPHPTAATELADHELADHELADHGQVVDSTAEHTAAGDTEIQWSHVASPSSVDESTAVVSADDLDDPKSLELSAEYVGRWSTLVSTTNWEKGRIIVEWRDALMGSESPAAAYSDEAWGRRVGGVSSQHVGRLRRVYERFGNSFQSYAGIYWSHFLAALDWDDAELWLEGAVQSGWSVSHMRRTRWESSGAVAGEEPSEEDIVADGSIGGGMDEDYTPLAEADRVTGAQDAPREVAEGPRFDGPDFGDENDTSPSSQLAGEDDDDVMPWDDASAPAIPGESPFARLPSLPVDLAEALEQFKLAIIRHRAGGWSEVSQADVNQALDALKAFTAL